jgi:regulator of sigma E protease
VVIGIGIDYDAENAVVAKTIDVDGVKKLDIPRGALITAVDGEPVGSFYDVINIIKNNEFCGQRISIDYRIDEDIAGGVSVDPAKWAQAVTVQMMLSDFVPLAVMEKLYKADNGLEAVKIGCIKTKRMLFQAITTLKMFISGQVGAKSFLGPVGILKTSYQIVKERPLIDFFNWIAMISIFIAVMNSLPILPFDGGHVVILAIEKLRGKPIDERVQAGFAYVGLFLVLILILYITYYDVFFR